MTKCIRCAVLMLAACLSIAAKPAWGQTPPPHPRIMFDATELPAILARVNTPGTLAAQGYGSLATTAGWNSPSLGSWYTMASLRKIHEVALRYALTGDPIYGDRARNGILAAIGTSHFTPTGQYPYQYATYAACLALSFDLIHDHLSASQRSTIVAHLEAWASAMEGASTVVGSYASYSGCTDNYSFSLGGGIAICLLAIWGESNQPNVLTRLQTQLAKLRDGWMDGVSPDGSMDESYGYMNYGQLWSLYAAIGARNCGLGDTLRGTNLVRVPKWLASSLLWDANRCSLPWLGDSSGQHKGMRWDPVLCHLVLREQDAEGLWALRKAFDPATGEAVGNNSVTWGLSPFAPLAVYGPSFAPQAPSDRSRLFRDNLNVAPASSNKKVNDPTVGSGGTAHLRNSSDPAQRTPFALSYVIKDEWTNHGHEDDGHLVIAAGGRRHFIDQGYGVIGYPYPNAQDRDHNLVTVLGSSSFGGNTTNYFNPPGTDGRFHGRLVARLLSPVADYVHGDHSHMWGMVEADRSVVLVKDAVAPYAIVVDEVLAAGTGSKTYEQRWNSAAPMSGQGSASNPFVVNTGGTRLYSSYLEPSNLSLSAGSSTTTGNQITFWNNRVNASATGGVDFIALHTLAPISSTTPLQNPTPNLRGGRYAVGPHDDKLLVRVASGAWSDFETSGDAALALLRFQSGSLVAWSSYEGQELVHDGTLLYRADAVIQIAVDGTRIALRRPEADPQAGSVPYVTVTTASAINEVLFEGQPIPFTQTGNEVIIGTPPVPTSGDRFYTFADGDARDAQLGTNVFVTASEQVTGSGNDAWISPRGGASYPNQPLLVSADMVPTGDAMGSVGRLRFGMPNGTSDLLLVDVHFDFLNGARLLLSEQGGAPYTVPLGYSASVTPYRFSILYDPAGGRVQVYDRWARLLADRLVTPSAADLDVRLELESTAFFDNFAVWDSAEDGVTPQGVALWGMASGRIGFAAQSELLSQGALLSIEMAGTTLPWGSLGFGLNLYAFENLVANGSYPYLGALPPPRELGFESSIPVGVPTQSIPMVFVMNLPNGIEFRSGILY